jgi:hypothetical protein
MARGAPTSLLHFHNKAKSGGGAVLPPLLSELLFPCTAISASIDFGSAMAKASNAFSGLVIAAVEFAGNGLDEVETPVGEVAEDPALIAWFITPERRPAGPIPFAKTISDTIKQTKGKSCIIIIY